MQCLILEEAKSQHGFSFIPFIDHSRNTIRCDLLSWSGLFVRFCKVIHKYTKITKGGEKSLILSSTQLILNLKARSITLRVTSSNVTPVDSPGTPRHQRGCLPHHRWRSLEGSHRAVNQSGLRGRWLPTY